MHPDGSNRSNFRNQLAAFLVLHSCALTPPMVLDHNPMVLDRKPMVLDRKPMVHCQTPMVLDWTPMVLDREPVVHCQTQKAVA